jgi:hypothetical protein
MSSRLWSREAWVYFSLWFEIALTKYIFIFVFLAFNLMHEDDLKTGLQPFIVS